MVYDIQSGFDIYINTDTGESKSILNSMNYGENAGDIWKDEYQDMNDRWKNYIKIEPPQSYDVFEIIENFINNLPDSIIKSNFIENLNKQKSLSYINEIIENSEFREEWYIFKDSYYFSYLDRNLKLNNIIIED